MDDLNFILIIVGVIVLAVLYKAFFVDGKKSADGRIDGRYITREQLLKILSEFTPQKINKTRVEQGIQKELGRVLKDNITLVREEYPLEEGRQIDFNIGDNKKYGVEVKVAKSLLKTTEWDRFQSQLRNYLTHYKDENLILVLFGSETEQKEARMHHVEEFCKKNKVHLIYKKIEYPTIEKV